MFDEELFRKEFYGNHTQVVFSKRSITGKVVFVGGKGFKYNFDENNEKQMKMLADILNAFYERIEDDIKTSEDEQRLKDFHWLIKTLNNYREID